MDYGHFSEDGREYVITRFPTPRGWENYLSNREYGLRVEETGAGYSVLPVAPGCRITYASPAEPFSKVFYLRDEESGRHWSLSWQPVGGEYEEFRCRHGLGYTVFEMDAQGIQSDLRVLVPPEGPLEIWTARIRNPGSEARRLTLFPYVEWHLAPYLKPWDNYRNYIEAHWVEREGLVVATLYDPRRPGETFVGFAGVAPEPSGWDTEREAFLGSGAAAAPEAVTAGACRGSDMPGDGRAIAAFSVPVELEAGEETRVTLAVGFSGDAEARRSLCQRWLDGDGAEKAFGEVRAEWHARSAQPRVETPDPRLDRMTNHWLKANILQLTRVIREGMRGYRDTLQDAMGVVSFEPERARDLLVEALSYQYEDGHAPRQFSCNGAPHDRRVFNDSPLWPILAVSRYLKETGDFGLLRERVPFFESRAEGAVFEHLARAVEWIDARRGLHDLIQIGRGDWCDALDEVGPGGDGVSVWLSQAFHLALLEFADLCTLEGKGSLGDSCRERARRLRAAIEGTAWDGEWYLCAVSDSGRRLGARGEPAMEIYLNTQSWAVIGGTADLERARRALEAADERLDSRWGPLLFSPPFHEYDPDVGRLSVLRPGCGENGTVYVHAAVFAVLANLMAKRPDRAVGILQRIAPMMEGQDPEVTRAAPYAYVNSYVGPCHPAHEGRTLVSWFTSCASWTLLAITDWLLGVRPTLEGLVIDPCLPADWERARLARRWRGAHYEVEIRKPRGIISGRIAVAVDGVEQEGALVVPQADGREHRVEVRVRAE